MDNAAKTLILDARIKFEHQPFIKLLRLSSGLATTIIEARTEVRVCCGTREAVGRGSIYLSDLWAWPKPSLSHQERDAALREYTSGLAGVMRRRSLSSA